MSIFHFIFTFPLQYILLKKETWFVRPLETNLIFFKQTIFFF